MAQRSPVHTEQQLREQASAATTMPGCSSKVTLSQGLTSLLNAPANSNFQLAGLGGIWCWPLGTDAELSMAVPPPSPGILPNITLDHFAAFLETCGELLASYAEERRLLKEQLGMSDIVYEPGVEVGLRAHLPTACNGPGQGLVEAMRAVPLEFFDEDFSLARPNTWRKIVSTEGESQRLARMDEYSGYLDVIESQLQNEIAARSDNFFEAAGIVQDLRGSMHRAFSQLKIARLKVDGTNSEMHRAARISVHYRRRLANVRAVVTELEWLEEVEVAQEALELLLPQGDYGAVLDVLDSMKATLKLHSNARLTAIVNLPERLAESTENVNHVLEKALGEAVRFHDREEVTLTLIKHAGSEPAHLTGQIDKLVADTAAHNEVERGGLIDGLMPIILGMKKTGRLVEANRVLRETFTSESNLSVREMVEQSLQCFQETKNAQGLASKLQALKAESFVCLLTNVQLACLAGLSHMRHVSRCIEVILRLHQDHTNTPPLTSVCQDIAQQSCVVMQHRWIKLMEARLPEISELGLKDLQSLLAASQGFTDVLQSADCKPTSALRSACQAQGKLYLESMHRSYLDTIITAAERETWLIAASRPKDDEAISCLYKRAGLTEGEASFATSARAPGLKEDRFRSLKIGSHHFHAVASELLLLQLIVKYIEFADTVPDLGAETAHRVVELIKVFNSRVCQLVLGAGAMQTAGLKSITAKHLALSCQCIGALVELQPALTATLMSIVPTACRAVLLPELGLLLQDLMLHRTELHSKLVNIMRERLFALLKQLPQISTRWNGNDGTALSPSSFALVLSKQLKTLFEVLEPLLLQSELQIIFGRIASLYSKNIAEAFKRLEPMGKHWEFQAQTDIKYLLAALRNLPISESSRTSSLQHLQSVCQQRFMVGREPDSDSGHSSSAVDGPAAAWAPPG